MVLRPARLAKIIGEVESLLCIEQHVRHPPAGIDRQRVAEIRSQLLGIGLAAHALEGIEPRRGVEEERFRIVLFLDGQLLAAGRTVTGNAAEADKELLTAPGALLNLL